MATKCNCYHEDYGKSYCWGTAERELCSCDGEKSRCNFYPSNREEALSSQDGKLINCGDIYRELLSSDGYSKSFAGKFCLSLLENAQPVDAVKVIRCSECDYREDKDGVYEIENCCWCRELERAVALDGYCYRGKLKVVDNSTPRYVDANILKRLYEKWLLQLESPEDAGDRTGVETCLEVLNDTPTADVESVQYAHWIYEDSEGVYVTRCSACGYEETGESLMKYKGCPMCRAKIGDKVDGGNHEPRPIDADELDELYENTEDTNLDNFSVPVQVVRQNIKDMPTLDYAPVRHGVWLIREDGYTCSLCGRKEKIHHEYCHCGALMSSGVRRDSSD